MTTARIDAQDEKAAAERDHPRKRRGAPQARRKRGEACYCGCGQKSAATMRQRRLRCDECGCPLRMTRTWLEVSGAPVCGCGGRFVPDCLEDRARIPGADGEAAWRELSERMNFSSLQSERAKAGADKRRFLAALAAGEVERPALTDDVLAMVMTSGEYARHLAAKREDEMPF